MTDPTGATSAAIGAELVDVELTTTGFAQVIVALAPGAAPQDAAAAAAPVGRRALRRAPAMAAMATSVLADLERYFTVPSSAQDSALALTRVTSAARRARRAVRAATTAKRDDALEDVAVAAEAEVPKARLYPNLGVMLGTVDRSGYEGLRSDPRVHDVQAAPAISLIRPAEAAAATKRPGLTWGLERIGAPALWDAGFTGRGVLVGHLDTGVDGSHPALAGAIAAFAEFDSLGKQVKNAKARDSAKHGTHTAGTIVGRRVGQTQFGVAPEAQLASAIVIEGGNVIARILGGMDWAVGKGVRILNMSLGLRGFTPAFLMLSRALRSRGVLPIFAVGNEGPGTSRSPGNYVEALSVGAGDEQGAVAEFSGSQRFVRANDPLVPDVVAPGVKVLSCVPNKKYEMMSGSSMATPHVAGLAALLMQASPSATPDQIEKAIFDSCALPAGMQSERANRGVPNGPRAFQLLTGAALATPGPIAARSTARSKGRTSKPRSKRQIRSARSTRRGR